MHSNGKNGKNSSTVSGTGSGSSPSNKTTGSGNTSAFDRTKTGYDSECLLWRDHANHFVLVVAYLPKTSIMLPINIIIAHCTALRDILWLMPTHNHSLNISQLYEETETNSQKLENITQCPNKEHPKIRITGPMKLSSTRSILNESRRF